ncbi:DUF1971 domain-containing protein, partial [Escherichia coli]
DRNRSHWSTSKTPSYTKSVSWQHHRLSVMHGAVKYLGYADEHSTEPDQVILIEAGQFAVFPPEKWHNIEAMTDDTYFNIDFFVAPEVLMEGAQQRKVIHNGK